jgi:hypothetical protein
MSWTERFRRKGALQVSGPEQRGMIIVVPAGRGACRSRQGSNWLDRLIAAVAPAWAYRRSRFREALRVEAEPADARRGTDDGGWMSIENPNNPLNPDRMRVRAEGEAVWPARRPWSW